MMRIACAIFLCCIVFATGSSQDLHYSQFYNSPINLNPAHTGIFNGDRRFTLNYRNQYDSGLWETFGGSYDMKFYPKRERNGFLSGGLVFNYDVQGLSKLKLTNVNVALSYTGILNENNLLTIGGLIGFASRGFSSDLLTWDRQWDGRFFDPNLGSGETFNSDRISFLETAIGVNYRWQKDKRTKFDLGIGAFHFIEPEVGFYSTDDIKLPMRISLSGIGSVEVAPALDLQLNLLGQFQGESQEFIVGGLGKIHVSKKRGKETELHVGVGYRNDASLFPIAAIQFKNFYGGVSYDFDHTDFDDISGERPSTIEFHFRYIMTDVRVRKTKVCPIF
jgi:type IX secretion system PorP/SprF family membrane protein